MSILPDITAVIGNTPMIRLNRLTAGLKAEVGVKLEFCNPGSSIKDRIALNMIETAEREGIIFPHGTLVEATSGNTGIGLAMIAAAKGYKLIIVMPESMSVERRKLIAHFGAELVLTPAAEGMSGAVKTAEKIVAETPNSFLVCQFSNPSNPETHVGTTAAEILCDTEGKLNVFVAGVGTGGTISGVGKGLKAVLPDVEIVAVEPADSAVISGNPPGKHAIQGIGAGFIPKNLDRAVIDRIMTVTNDEAIQTARLLASEEGILCGISSGANVSAALKLAADPAYEGKRIVTIICDTGERYLSTALFE